MPQLLDIRFFLTLSLFLNLNASSLMIGLYLIIGIWQGKILVILGIRRWYVDFSCCLITQDMEPILVKSIIEMDLIISLIQRISIILKN